MAAYTHTASRGLVFSPAREHDSRNPAFWLPRAVTGFFESLATANAAARSYERLNYLSDAELKARGYTREDVARAVFERYYSYV